MCRAKQPGTRLWQLAKSCASVLSDPCFAREDPPGPQDCSSTIQPSCKSAASSDAARPQLPPPGRLQVRLLLPSHCLGNHMLRPLLPLPKRRRQRLGCA